MGQIISRNAGVDRIIDAVSKTLTRAAARGGEVKALAEARLLPVHTALVALERQLTEARSEDDILQATLMARDNESDLEIGAVIDEIWNALGRPAQSVDYDLIVGTGKNAWTDGDPVKQPHLMKVLATNIRHSGHGNLVERKETWAARIEQKAAAQAQAASPLDASEAQVTSLGMQRRTLAKTAQVGLTRLKREFKNLGLTESQIHEVIPDAPVSSAAAVPVNTIQTGNATPNNAPS
jgi:hypothetical protein